jgi:hypothetical protein
MIQTVDVCVRVVLLLYVEPHGGLSGSGIIFCGVSVVTVEVSMKLVLCAYSSTIWNDHSHIHKITGVCTLSPPLCVAWHGA